MNESFDTNLDKTEIPEDSLLHQMGNFSAQIQGGSNFKMHKLAGSGYMIQFVKDGATELHHVDDNLSGGYLKKNQPSLKMISTYKNHIKNIVDSGNKVRISAHDKLADSFYRISKGIVARNPGYDISEPNASTHEITGDQLKSWVISK